MATLALLSLWGGVGCSSPDLSGPSSVDPAQLPWKLALSAHAITLSIAPGHNTLQLTAAPSTVDGAPLPGAPTVAFSTSDSSLRVSATGLLTARSVRNNVQVIATLVERGVRISDTAFVNITADSNPPVFQQLQLQLEPGEAATIPATNLGASEIYGISDRKRLQLAALDGTGTSLPNTLVRVDVSDVRQGFFPNSFSESYAYIAGDAGSFDVHVSPATRVGVPFTLYASATIYGVTLRDSVRIVVTEPLSAVYTITKSAPAGTTTPIFSAFPQFEQIIGIGGWVWWINSTTPADSLDVVFDDPSAASPDDMLGLGTGGGNIAPFPGNSDWINTFQGFDSRQFLRAGTFHWHSTRTGVSGTIVVR
jgi:hypothetical protein